MYEHFGFELVAKVLIIRGFLRMIASKPALAPDLARLGWHGKYLAAPWEGIDAERGPASAFVSLTF